MTSHHPIDDTHIVFHQILARITKIRTALWELEQTQSQPNELLQVATNESAALLEEIESLKNHIYQLSNKQ